MPPSHTHQEEYGPPSAIQLRKWIREQAEVQQAYKRLRRRKSPYPIHRRRAFESAFQYEMGQREVQQQLAGGRTLVQQ